MSQEEQIKKVLIKLINEGINDFSKILGEKVAKIIESLYAGKFIAYINCEEKGDYFLVNRENFDFAFCDLYNKNEIRLTLNATEKCNLLEIKESENENEIWVKINEDEIIKRLGADNTNEFYAWTLAIRQISQIKYNEMLAVQRNISYPPMFAFLHEDILPFTLWLAYIVGDNIFALVITLLYISTSYSEISGEIDDKGYCLADYPDIAVRTPLLPEQLNKSI